MKTRLILILLTAVLAAGESRAERLINVRDSYPSVSPDGKTLVFQSNRNGLNQLYVMDVESKRTRQLTDFAHGAETPVFAPDGRRIVFAVYVDAGNNDVFVINADGSDMRRLTSGPGYDGHPHWSSDGQRIVFNSDRTTPNPDAPWSERWHEIFSMRADGGDVRQHTQCKAVCTYPSLSPDGTKLLYRKVIESAGLDWGLGTVEKNSEIFTADLDGGNETNLSKNAAFDGWPLWSSDGQRIVFASNRAGPALTGQIWVMNADGTGVRQLSNGRWSHVQPAWSSDGDWIYAYQNEETPDYEFGSIVRIAVD
jgi:Tol biopolymer transport system component